MKDKGLLIVFGEDERIQVKEVFLQRKFNYKKDIWSQIEFNEEVTNWKIEYGQKMS